MCHIAAKAKILMQCWGNRKEKNKKLWTECASVLLHVSSSFLFLQPSEVVKPHIQEVFVSLNL